MANFYKKNLTWKSCSPKFFQTNSNEEYFLKMAKTMQSMCLKTSSKSKETPKRWIFQIVGYDFSEVGNWLIGKQIWIGFLLSSWLWPAKTFHNSCQFIRAFAGWFRVHCDFKFKRFPIFLGQSERKCQNVFLSNASLYPWPFPQKSTLPRRRPIFF